MKSIAILIAITFVVTNRVCGQVTIANGDVTSCNQVIYDSGDVGGAGYSNNETYTITICPDDPVKAINLDFQICNLDPTNTAPGGQPSNADFISIFDGDDIGATSLGTYVGNQLDGVLVGTSSSNTSGCITLTFQSNDAGTGTFTILATCSTPCANPVAAATSNPDTIARICKGESVSFDGSNSFAQTGFNIDMYYWDYDEGDPLDSLSGVTTTHTFNNAGAHRVKLIVRDDNPDVRCFNTNAVEMVVLVAPDPIFDPLTVGDPVCLGESINVTAFPNQYSQTWTGAPYANLGGAQYIPDQVGSCFNSTLNFGVFNPGQQVTSVNDIQNISINFEHSYMGDLQISIICPTGQSVIMHNQGGSGTHLGVPIDPGNGPGVGWDYSWSPSATNGTWVDNSAGNATLPAGTYQSLNPLTGLIGCSLNGVWQIQVCDLLGSDDGYIFSWGIDFDPSLFPGVSSFTPQIGLQSDSSFWNPDPTAVMSADGNGITVTPTSAGNHNYTYTVIDNHGCTNDTTITVTVTPNPTTNAGVDAVACANTPLQLNGSVSPNPGSVVYSWSPATGLSDPNISNPTATINTNTTYTLKAYKTGHPLCYTEDQITITVTDPPYSGRDTLVEYCQTDPAVDMFTLLGTGVTTGGTWTDTTNSTVNSVFNPAMQGSNIFKYEVTAADGCKDTTELTINVARPFVLNLSSDTTICENGSASLRVNPTGGFGAPYTESWDQGLVGNGSHIVTPTSNQCYNVSVTDVNGCVSQTETVCVNLNPPLQLTNSGNTSICLNTNAVLDAVLSSGGDGGPYNYVWSDGTNTISSNSQAIVSPTTTTQYCLTMTDNCESTPVTECLSVSLYEQPIASFNADKVDGCYPIQVTFTNNTQPHLVGSVLWSFGNGTTSDVLNNVKTVYGAPICYDVKLTVTSPDGCIDDTMITNYICPFDYPKAEFSMSPNPTTFFNTNISFENESSNDAVIYKWDFGADAKPQTSTQKDAKVRYPTEKTGVYPVNLIVENANGCTDTITHELVVNSVFTLYVPNAFSPNNDNINETFYVKGESIDTEEFLLRIFDRNGMVVFETTDITKAWDGRSKNGKLLPTGVYVWKIEAKDLYSDYKEESFGNVSLIR